MKLQTFLLFVPLTILTTVIVTDWLKPNSYLRSIYRSLNATESKAHFQPQSVTLNEIRGIGALATIEQTMALPIPAEQSAQVLGLTYGTTKLLLLTEVKVSAGINIEQITSDKIQQTATGVVIQLPAPKILSADLDAKKTTVFDYNRGLLGLGPDTGPQLQTQAQQLAIEKARTAACQSGILTQANDRARSLLQSFLRMAQSNRTVEIQLTRPTSCSN